MTRFFVGLKLEQRANSDKPLEHPAAIINLSSITAVEHIYQQSIYGSSKALIHNFSQSLHVELSDKNFHVLSATPSYVSTRFNSFKNGFWDITPNQCAVGILKDLAVAKTHSYPSIKQEMLHHVVDLLGCIDSRIRDWLSTWQFEKSILHLQNM